ncbi:alpha-glucosidase C-terminal domain-containing protein, partial [Kocuria arenosa]|uniref:alpha-glucosidase C-terminal domain-containing protein n=1 Tax=Kocuria arenosa TaxID=3071446 RepID=UPI0034D444CF
NPNHEVVNAEAARADGHSVFHHYRRLIELRHTEPVVALGDFTMLLPGHEQVYAFTRRLEDVELLVLCNVSGEEVRADLPDGWAGTELLIGNRAGVVAPGDEGVLRPWEARVHRRTHDVAEPL